MIKLELLFGFVTFALWVFCLVDCIQTREGDIRNLSKTIWLLLVLFFPFAGSIAWLVAGRPETARPRAYERQVPDFPEYDRPGRAAAVDPEKDAEFLRRVRERAEAQRKQHEAERRAREQRPPTAEE